MDKFLDILLDDMIKTKKNASGRGKGSAPWGCGARGGSFNAGKISGGGRGSGRQVPLGVNTRPSFSAIAKASPIYSFWRRFESQLIPNDSIVV